MLELIKTDIPIHNEVLNGWLNMYFHKVIEKDKQFIVILNNETYILDIWGFKMLDANDIEITFNEMSILQKNRLIRLLPEFGELLK